MVELLFREPAQLDHLFHRYTLFSRLAALARRTQLLNLGQEPLDGGLDVLLRKVGLGRAQPSCEDLAVGRAFRRSDWETEDAG